MSPIPSDRGMEQEINASFARGHLSCCRRFLPAQQRCCFDAESVGLSTTSMPAPTSTRSSKNAMAVQPFSPDKACSDYAKRSDLEVEPVTHSIRLSGLGGSAFAVRGLRGINDITLIWVVILIAVGGSSSVV